MGLSPFKNSSSSFDTPKCDKCGRSNYVMPKPPEPKLPNPDPNNYEVLAAVALRGHLAIELKYPDCTNYEGHKILVFKNTTIQELMLQKTIDPHFSNNKNFKSPFARFEPTKEGWKQACNVLVVL